MLHYLDKNHDGKVDFRDVFPGASTPAPVKSGKLKLVAATAKIRNLNGTAFSLATNINHNHEDGGFNGEHKKKEDGLYSEQSSHVQRYKHTFQTG